MAQGADADRPADPFSDQVRFKPRGYGQTCLLCGSLVVGADGEEVHRRHHQAIAMRWRPAPS